MNVRSLLLMGFVASVSIGSATVIDLRHTTNGVWSTGFSAPGGVILAGGATDPHYTIVSVPAGCNLNPCTGGFSLPLAAFVVIGSNSPGFIPADYPFFPPVWSNNSSAGMWIGPKADQNDITDNQFASNTSPWIYRMSFLLPAGFGNTVINLNWISDNSIGGAGNPSTVRVNGVGVLSGGNPVSNLGQGSNITSAGNNLVLNGSNANFVSGLNNIDFVVYNQTLPSGPNPSGLRVVINSAQADDLPEPATLGLLAAGLLTIAMVKRRK